MRLLLIITILHFVEHIIQLMQLYVLHLPRAESMGLVGLYFPWLMKTEIFHYVLALYMLIAMYKYRHYFRLGTSNREYWDAAVAVQYFHHFEHFILLVQAWTGNYLLDKSVPTSIGQLFFPKIELHFIYNLIVFALMCLAFTKNSNRSLINV